MQFSNHIYVLTKVSALIAHWYRSFGIIESFHEM